MSVRPMSGWPAVSSLHVPLHETVTLALLSESEVEALTEALEVWYPDIATGMESCHLEPEFYHRQAALEGGDVSRDLLPIVFKQGDRVIGLITLERNTRAGFVTSRMGALAPECRGLGLANAGPAILEAVGRAMGAGLLYYFATLKIVHQQKAAEKAGFALVGILPAFDLDTVAPGKALRVHEAIYAKVLAAPEDCYTPSVEALTPRTLELWKTLFGKESL